MPTDLHFDGTIQWLSSTATGKTFPNLVFRGDVDFVTSGLVALTSTSKTEIVATTFQPEEVYLHDRPEFAERCEERINQELERTDLRIVSLLRTESDPIDAAGMSFQEYQARVKPPRLFYRDIHAEGSEAQVVREESIDDYIAGGGTLTDKTKSA